MAATEEARVEATVIPAAVEDAAPEAVIPQTSDPAVGTAIEVLFFIILGIGSIAVAQILKRGED